ncbi:MAG: hypothetical protein R3F53_02525 [Gammaproteobacteria bacterium]
MAQRHFTLADNLTVSDNILLGTEPLFARFMRGARPASVFRNWRSGFGLAVKPSAQVARATVGEKQRRGNSQSTVSRCPYSDSGRADVSTHNAGSRIPSFATPAT